jgi:hypothetical protein
MGDSPAKRDAVARASEFDSNYPTSRGFKDYHVHHVVTGSTVMFGAGILSGMLGKGYGTHAALAPRGKPNRTFSA